MKWVTRDFVHLDRVAVPWLIKRFIDPDAVFVFVPWGKEDTAPADAIPFGLPGTELGPHDAAGSTFQKVITKYKLNDPALQTLAEVIQAGIDNVLHGTEPEARGRAAIGILAISEGTLLLEDDDAAIITRSLPMYDALYAFYTAHQLAAAKGEPIPGFEGQGPTRPTRYLRSLLKAAGKRS